MIYKAVYDTIDMLIIKIEMEDDEIYKFFRGTPFQNIKIVREDNGYISYVLVSNDTRDLQVRVGQAFIKIINGYGPLTRPEGYQDKIFAITNSETIDSLTVFYKTEAQIARY